MSRGLREKIARFNKARRVLQELHLDLLERARQRRRKPREYSHSLVLAAELDAGDCEVAIELVRRHTERLAEQVSLATPESSKYKRRPNWRTHSLSDTGSTQHKEVL